MPYRVDVVNWQQAKKQLMTVRQKVFVYERRIPFEVEFDQFDRQAHHVLVTDEESNEPLATGRITDNGEISRICVVIPQRKSPIGKEVIKTLLQIARQRKVEEVYINSALDAVDYFTKHHFRPVGSVFMEAGIPRQRMVCNIANVDFKRFYLSH
ncbi:GNAT family N-acetyltransferase [Thalassotalea aquiviva]|uniref:GNAT family N-acetyltransferase n=1 Tax=Thalassotalea aquiviva TaxID=3242415 RepID=UPI00352AE4B1